MPTTPLRSALHAALAAARDGCGRRTDAELLAAFASARDEAAFAELVRRHGRLVRGTARRVLGGRGDEEDVFQAAFLLLARKASALPWGATVGPWLYQVARRLGLRARARAARRAPPAPLGPDVPAPLADPSAGLAWAEVRAALDDALAALPAHLRDPLILCYLDGLTQDEAAAALGCSPATVKGRVTRGRERLRRLLARRGLALSAALAGPLVSEAPVPAAAAAATARTAAAFRATGVAPAAVRGLLRGCSFTPKVAAGLFGLALVCVAAVVGWASPRSAGPPQTPAPTARTDTRELAKPAVDFLGDPLPPGAVARLGTRRLCGICWDPIWAAFSLDGTKVAAQGHFAFTVWDAATGRQLLERKDYLTAGNALGWRPDGTGVAVVQLPDRSYFVSAFTDPDEKLPNPPQVRVNSVPNPYIHYLALSPDAKWVAVVRNPGAGQFTIALLPATPGRLLSTLKPQRTLGPFPGPCRDIRYTAGGQIVTLHGEWANKGDWSLAVIDPKRNAIARTARIPAPGFCPWQYMLSLSADARLAAVPPRTKVLPNDHDGTIRVRDLTAGKELWSLPFPDKAYGTGHAFTPDGKRLILSTRETYFQVWDLATGKEAIRSSVPKGAIYRPEASAIAVSPDGKRFATARRDGRVDIWDTATGKAVPPLATHWEDIDTAAVSPDGRLVATADYNNSVRVWELASGKAVCTIPAARGGDSPGPALKKRRLAFTPDGRGLLFVAGGAFALADPRTGTPLALPGGLRGRKGYVGGFAADGKTLATFADDTVTLWDWPSGAARLNIKVAVTGGRPPGGKPVPSVSGVHSLALSPDGRFLFTHALLWMKDRPAAGAYHNANDLWDARTGKLLHRLKAPQILFPPAAFAPENRVVYLGGQVRIDAAQGRLPDGSVEVWDPVAGEFLRRFAAPPPSPGISRAMSLAVSPDGRLLAAAEGTISSPAIVWVYETASGRVVKKLAGHSHWVNDLAFSPDGRRLVSVSADATGLVWDVTLPALAGGEKPAGKGLAEAWDRLADPDPARGYAGIAALAADPAEAVPLLRARLRPSPVPTEAELDRLIGQLGAKTFAERTKALAELDRFGPNAAPGVKARLARPPSAEVRARLVQFLARHDGPEPSPYHLRCVRGVAALEAVGTADARALLAGLATGPATDPLTREARAASRRLASR
jgi:RNA polymerase sigma factor (sigma-70 family)